MPVAEGLALHVQAAAGAPVLVHEQDRRTRSALLAVEFHPVDRSERAHSAWNPEVFTTCIHFAIFVRMTSENCPAQLSPLKPDARMIGTRVARCRTSLTAGLSSATHP